MSKKKNHTTQEEILAEAQRILAEAQQKKQGVFLKEYKELCVKHGMELVAAPMFQIMPLKRD